MNFDFMRRGFIKGAASMSQHNLNQVFHFIIMGTQIRHFGCFRVQPQSQIIVFIPAIFTQQIQAGFEISQGGREDGGCFGSFAGRQI